jgi:hypothetical protein
LPHVPAYRFRPGRQRFGDGWPGEIEGLQASLDTARQKMEQIRRTRTRAIPLKLSPAPARHRGG